MRFEPNLCYCNPAHGGWGIIRVAALIPGSYLLFVCPSACFRHGALGAIQHHYKNRLSYLYIDQEDIVDGYDQLIMDGAEELLERTEEDIKLLFIYVSCLDDFIGTDLDKVASTLEARHPGILFRGGHMNPIASSTKMPPAVTTFDAMLSVLPVHDELDNGITIWGNFVGIPEECELIRVLEKHGHKVRQISSCRDFSEYEQMSKSSLSLVFKPFANYALSRLEKRTHASHIAMPVSYDMDSIEEEYEVLEKTLGESILKDLSEERKRTEESIQRAKEEVGDLDVFVSDSATVFPCSLACALLKYGFHVTRVYLQEVVGPDQVYATKLQSEYPEIQLIQADHPDSVHRCEEDTEALAVGEEAAYLSHAIHVADISSDEGMFGFHGIRILMDAMAKAVKEKADIRMLIEQYGGIV